MSRKLKDILKNGALYATKCLIVLMEPFVFGIKLLAQRTSN